MFISVKKQLVADIVINVFLPLVTGILLYYTNPISSSNGFITNQGSDGCWAYAFISLILIIWDRQINRFWIFSALISAIAFEIFQSLHFIAGTGDILDVFTYFLATAVALICNKSLKRRFIITPYTY